MEATTPLQSRKVGIFRGNVSSVILIHYEPFSLPLNKDFILVTHEHPRERLITNTRRAVPTELYDTMMKNNSLSHSSTDHDGDGGFWDGNIYVYRSGQKKIDHSDRERIVRVRCVLQVPQRSKNENENDDDGRDDDNDIHAGKSGISRGAFEYCTNLTSIEFVTTFISSRDDSDNHNDDDEQQGKNNDENEKNCAIDIDATITSVDTENNDDGGDNDDGDDDDNDGNKGGCKSGNHHSSQPSTASSLRSSSPTPFQPFLTAIESEAFMSCYSLKAIEIPTSVHYIGTSAFAGCTSLTMVDFPTAGNNSIADSVRTEHSVCKIIGTNNMPHQLSKIASSAFLGCSRLESIHLPPSLQIIEREAFAVCSRLTSIKFGGMVGHNQDVNNHNDNDNNDNSNDKQRSSRSSSMTTQSSKLRLIGNGAFASCRSLREIEIPDSVTSMGDKVFCGCRDLQRIRLSHSLVEMGNNTFQCCSSLNYVTLPQSMEVIGQGAFRDCTSLTSICLSNNLKRIGKEAFLGCSSLTCIDLPETVMEIGECAFINCYKLTRINLPPSLRHYQRTEQQNDDDDGNESDKVRQSSPRGLFNDAILAQWCLDLNRGGRRFIQRHSQQEKKYPPSLWPLILRRLLGMDLSPPFWLLEIDRASGSNDDSGDGGDGEGQAIHSQTFVRRASAIFYLLVNGVSMDCRCEKS